MTSAISGLTVATDNVTQDMVVGISCAILVVLFMAQFAGTDKVAFTFSPIVILWLLCNAIIGVYNLARNGAEALEVRAAPGLSRPRGLLVSHAFSRDGWPG